MANPATLSSLSIPAAGAQPSVRLQRTGLGRAGMASVGAGASSIASAAPAKAASPINADALNPHIRRNLAADHALEATDSTPSRFEKPSAPAPAKRPLPAPKFGAFSSAALASIGGGSAAAAPSPEAAPKKEDDGKKKLKRYSFTGEGLHHALDLHASVLLRQARVLDDRTSSMVANTQGSGVMPADDSDSDDDELAKILSEGSPKAASASKEKIELEIGDLSKS